MGVNRVYINNENVFFDVFPGESIALAVSRVDYKHKMNGCYGGGCGVCRIKVVRGSFTTKKMSSCHVNEEDMEDGYYLGCKVYPTSDMEITYVGLKQKIYI